MLYVGNETTKKTSGTEVYQKSNKSFGFTSKASAMRKSILSEIGLYILLSIVPMLEVLVPTFSASSSCVKPIAFLK